MLLIRMLLLFLPALSAGILAYEACAPRRRTLIDDEDQDRSRLPPFFVIARALGFHRLIVPMIAGMGSAAYRDRKELHIDEAGLNGVVAVDDVIGLKVFVAVGPLVLLSLIFNPIFGLVGGVVFSVFPDLLLMDYARGRRRRILRELPLALDMMVLLTEAGSDFAGAIAEATDKLRPGPLKDEFTRMLREIRLGASRAEGLRTLADRVRISEVTTMCSALVQASEIGASIGATLRQQSVMMRTFRFQEAERQGGSASQKMVLPLVFFLLPAILLLVLAPAGLNYMYGVF